MRLDTLLYRNNFGSKKYVTQLFHRRQITIDGQPAQHLGQNVDPTLQEITVLGERITTPTHRYFLLNKPAGSVTANSDKKMPTVFDCLNPDDYVDGLYAVGRLDGDTEGLLLLTDNGPLGYRLLHPAYHVDKTYYVEVNGELNPSHVQLFAKGVTFIGGTTCKPATLTLNHTSTTHSTAYITLSEGKFHQIKKMFLSVGVKVTYLKRIAFAGLILENTLSSGSYRTLTKTELQVIKGYLD